MLDEKTKKIVYESLCEAIGKDNVQKEIVDTLLYRKDTYNLKFSEQNSYMPDFVVLPSSTEDVQKIVKIAKERKMPLIPKGGGSNRTGMLVPISGGIIVDTIKMNKVLNISKPNLSVTVQPGITLAALEEHLSKFGLALNQEQGSFRVATIGGSISTTGFSHKSQKYGTIADRLMSLEVVLADGSILRTGQNVLYTSSGYRLHQLFVSAEGTLGIITEATLRVEPVPEAKDIVLAFYDDFYASVDVSQRLMLSPITFTSADAYEIDDATIYGAPKGKNTVFFVVFEGIKGEIEAEVKYVRKLVGETGGTIADHDVAMQFLDIYPKLFCGARATTGIEDALTTYIPMEHIKEYYERLWNDIMPKYGLKPVPNEKLSLDVGRYRMLGGRFFIPKSDDGWEKYQKALREIAELVTSLGGSISSCHGVGIEHRDNLDLEFSPVALDVMRALKKALDPDNIMNPGKKLPMK